MPAFLDWIGTAAASGLAWWVARNIPGLACMLAGFGGLLMLAWLHRTPRTTYRFDARNPISLAGLGMSIILFGVGLLMLVGLLEAG